MDLFQSFGHCWVFQICWHIECSTFTASSFRIWNSSTGIPSHPLALFIVMLPKAHLTSHFRMSGCRWVITLLWLSGWWRLFLYSSSVYSCHLFLGKESAQNLGDLGLIPGLGRSPGDGNSYGLQYSCLENSMDRVLNSKNLEYFRVAERMTNTSGHCTRHLEYVRRNRR